MNKIERMLLLPLTVAAAAAGVVEGIIIYNKMAKVKVADAALKELEKENDDDYESEEPELTDAGTESAGHTEEPELTNAETESAGHTEKTGAPDAVPETDTDAEVSESDTETDV